MGGFLKCPKCNEPMFLCFDHDTTPPVVYHECSCGYSNKNIYDTSNNFSKIVTQLNKQTNGISYGKK